MRKLLQVIVTFSSWAFCSVRVDLSFDSLLMLLLLPVKIQYAKDRRRHECYLYLFLTPWSASFSKIELTQSEQQHIVLTLLKQESNKRDQPDDPVKSLDGRHNQCEIGKIILKLPLIFATVAGIVTLFSWMWEEAWEKIAAGWNSPFETETVMKDWHQEKFRSCASNMFFSSPFYALCCKKLTKMMVIKMVTVFFSSWETTWKLQFFQLCLK